MNGVAGPSGQHLGDRAISLNPTCGSKGLSSGGVWIDHTAQLRAHRGGNGVCMPVRNVACADDANFCHFDHTSLTYTQ